MHGMSVPVNWTVFTRIATGGDNGEIKLWNYSNGHCIRILDKGMHACAPTAAGSAFTLK